MPGRSCSIVIATRRRAQTLTRCLEAVSRLDYPGVQVVVVDNTSGDEATRTTCERHRVSYVVEPRIGVSQARNRGVRESDGEVIAFVDDDSLPDSSWLARLVGAFESDARVMAVTGGILPLDDDPQTLPAWLQGRAPSYPAWTFDRDVPNWFLLANFGGIGRGGNMAFRREVFSNWPGFSERLGRGSAMNACEENYALFSVIERGHRIVHVPDAFVRHPVPRDLDELRAATIRTVVQTTSYSLFLLVHARGHRREVLRFVWEGARGRRRAWRGPQALSSCDVLSQWGRAQAIAHGAGRFVRSVAARRN